MIVDRRSYEAAVKDLLALAVEMRAAGNDEEFIARSLIDHRNQLKLEARAGLAAELIDWMEDRNLSKYGHSVGPTADWLFERYGSWTAVIEAAARPADLNKRPF